jgi:4-amino-4-deoxy-L-arabinose transferase-like glycosyltransferase
MLCLFALAVLLPSIGSQASISGQDEYWLSFRTVLEMQDRGEWLTPYVNGEVRLQKPPLLYWAMRALFLAFGPSLWAARLPSVLCGVGFMLATTRLARHFGAPAQLAGLLVLGAAGVAVESRRAMFDLPVACFSTWAIYWSLCWWREGALRWLLATAVALAAAAMTKGPVALWFFVTPALAALFGQRRRPAGRWWHLAVATPVFAALALPWPIWAVVTYPQFWSVMTEQAEHRSFGFGNIARIPGVVGAALGLFVPWAIALIAAIVAVVRARHPRQTTARWLLTWIGIGLVPFGLMSSFERYMLAFTAPMALLTAAWLPTLSAHHLRSHLTAAIGLLIVPTALFGAFALWFDLALWTPLVALLLFWRLLRAARRPSPPLEGVAMGLCLTLALLLGGIYPAIGINRLPASLPSDLGVVPVATYGRTQPGMLSIVRGHSVKQLNQDAASLAAFHGYLFVAEEECATVEAHAKSAGVPLERLGRFGSFYSRRAWLRFFREDANWQLWKSALGERSVSTLQPIFVYYRVG